VLVRQSMLYLLARLITGAVGFAVLTLYTRLLTPAEYGFFTLVLATEGLAFTFSLLSLCSAALRLQSSAQDQSEFHSAIAFVFFAMALLLIAVFGLAPLFQSGFDRSACMWTVALLLGHGWLEINLHLQTARLNAARFVRASLLRTSVTAALGLGLVWSGYGVNGAMTGFLAGVVVPSIYLTLQGWRGIALRRPQLHTLRAIFVFGAPLSLGYALDSMVYYSDRIVIAYFGGSDAVGRYAAGFDLADKSLQAIMTAIGVAGYSLALKAYEIGDRQLLNRQLERNITLLLAAGVPATVGMITVAPELAHLLGTEFRSTAVIIIPIIAVTIFMGALRGNYFDHSFHLSRKTSWLASIVAVTAALNIFANLLLVPRMGVVGAAYATLIAHAICLAMSITIGRRAIQLPFPYTEALRIVLASAIMAMVINLMPEVRTWLALPLRVVAGASAFGVFALALNIGGVRAKMLRTVRFRARPLDTTG
jgi:O-antigen/teichoic acid export membrane protein